MSTGSVSTTVMVPQGRGGQIATIAVGSGTTNAFNKGDSPSFSDLIDIINPLQHIPVVNTIYRAVTGDHESAFADVIGGTLYGGPLGAGLAVADLGLREATGKDAGEHAMAWLGLGGKDSDAPKASDTAVAQASQPAAQVAAATAVRAKTLTTSSAVKPTPVTASATKPASSTAPTLTTASLSADDTAQLNAKLGTATPAIVPTASPYAAPTKAAAANNGPASIGDYLVFGGGNAPAQSAAAATSAPQVVASAATAPGPKTFTTIGMGAQPAADLPPAPDAVAGVTAAATPPSMRVASAANGTPKMFPVPQRTGPATPVQVLPPPTTGPGALPGGHSMALSAQEAAQQDPQHNFLTAYTQALDKYRNAQRLSQQQQAAGVAPGTMPGTTPGAAANTAPTSLLQPASAVVPAADGDSDESDSAVTLH